MKFREVNGQHLIPIEAYRLGDDYLITTVPGSPWSVCRVTGDGEGTALVLTLVDTWYGLPDAVQGALADRQSRAVTDCVWCRAATQGGMGVVACMTHGDRS